MSGLLDAIVGFIQENYTDLISSFPADSVRAVLTSKCSDLKKKVAKELKEKEVIIGSDDDGMLSSLIYYTLFIILFYSYILKNKNINSNKSFSSSE